MKLTKKDEQEFNDLASAYENAINTLNEAVDEYNQHVQPLLDATSDANTARESLYHFVRERAEAITEEFDGMSEKRQESDKGQAVSNQATAWEDVASELDNEMSWQYDPEELTVDGVDMDTINGLPMEPECLPRQSPSPLPSWRRTTPARRGKTCSGRAPGARTR